MRAPRLAILSAALVLAATRGAWAQAQPTARFAYARDAGAASCPDQSAVRAAVVARLGYDPFTDDASATSVRASIARRGRGLRASIEVHREGEARPGRDRPREIASREGDCDELARAMSLAISIAIDPLVLTRAEPVGASSPTDAPASPSTVRASPTTSLASPTTSPASPAERSATPNAPRSTANPAPARPNARPASPAPRLPPPHPAPARRPVADPLRLRVGLGLEGQYGFEPSIAPGARVLVGARIRRFGVDLELRGALPNALAFQTGTVSVGHAGGVVLACSHDVPVPWLTACALVSASVLVGTGANYAPVPQGPTRVLGPLFGVGARLGIEVPLGRLVALFANAEIAWVPTRGAFQITPAQPSDPALTAYTTPGYDVVAGAGALVHFR